MKKTKVVCTIGPASSEEDILEKIMISGMNIVRLNFSHGSHEEHKVIVEKVKRLREELDLPVALLLDTKGPEIRTGEFESDFAQLEENQIFTFVVEDIEGDNTRCTTSFKGLYKDVVPGNVVLVNDGLVEMNIEEVRGTDVVCRVKNSGLIGSHKGMHVRGASLSLPSLTEKDIQDIKFGIEHEFDFIAVSFVRNSEDVESIKNILKENGGQDILLISKIECREAVDSIDKIIDKSDGIMVARGDLGVDIPPEEVPAVQKMLISKCIKVGKPVITATQMLESMVNNPRPTRAEASDVANAIYDGTSAVMLSGETAAGKYPLESLQMMVRIINKTEDGIDYIKRFTIRKYEQNVNTTNAISHATCTTAHDLNASAIISITTSGHTAKQVSKFKPDAPIIAATTCKRIRRQLSLWWGINSFVIPIENNTDKLFSLAVDKSVDTGMVKKGDIVVITAGVPVGIKGTTNIMKVEIVGEDKDENK